MSWGPCIEPDNSVCETDEASWEQTPPDAEENGTSTAELFPPPTIDETIKCMCDYRKECLDDPELFRLMNALHSKLQSRKLKTQITKNNKQTNITAFFNWGSDLQNMSKMTINKFQMCY